MDSGISYDETSYTASTESAKVALNSLGDTKNSVSGVKSSIPSDFASVSTVNSALGEIETVCDSKDSIDGAFNTWSSLLTVMDKQSLDNSSNAVNLGNGTYFINFDGNIMIYVTQGSESGSDGVGYPLDQYVMGVLDGEHHAVDWGSKCYHGEITQAQYLNALKAFAIAARSYGLAQTVYSSRHSQDHKIQNGSTKQCFNTRLFTNTGAYKAWDLMSSTAAAASIETTGMVMAKNGVPISTYYVATKIEKMLEYSIAGYSYIDIVKTLYSDEIAEGASLQYYDYQTQTLLGEVPSDTKVSKYIGKNLGTSNTVGLSYKPSTEDIVTTVTTEVQQPATPAETVNIPATTGGSNSTGAVTTSTSTSGGNYTGGYSSSSSSSSSSGHSSGSSSSSGNSSSGNSSSNNSSTTVTTSIVNILPETKFSDAIPALSTGSLGAIEIGENFAKYEVKDLSDVGYATYINKLQNSGYTLSADGTNWTNGKYLINFQKNMDTNSIYISLFDNSNVSQI